MIASVSGILILTVVALPRPAEHVHGAADLLDVGLDHVHADAAAGDVGHLFGGGEAGQEDQLQQLALAHPVGLVARIRPRSSAFAAEPFGVDAAAVVGDLDVDLAAFVEGVQGQTTLRPACRAASRSSGGSMPWSTALRTRWVSGSLMASRSVLSSSVSSPSTVEPHLFAAGHGQVADLTRELVEDVADRLHPRLHDAFLQLGGDQVEALRRLQKGRVAPRGGELQDLIAGQHQFADQVHQPVEQADVHADAGVRQVRWSAQSRPGSSGAGRRGGAGCETGPPACSCVSAGDQGGVVAVALLRAWPRCGEDAPDRVHQGQQAAGDFRVEDELAIAEAAEQTLTGVGDCFQLGERQEAAGAFDGVKRTEDAGQPVAVPRLLFQGHQIAVELIQVLLALDEELPDDVVVVVHPRPFALPQPTGPRAAFAAAAHPRTHSA